MPKFKQFVNLEPPNYGAALKISGFYVANESEFMPNTEPFNHNAQLPLFSSGNGIDPSIRVASGEFFTETPQIKWHLVNPADDSVFASDEIASLSAFEGFEVNVRTETGELVNTVFTGDGKVPEIELSRDLLSTWFSTYDQEPTNDPLDASPNYRRFQVEVIATDYYGRKNTGIYFLNNIKNIFQIT